MEDPTQEAQLLQRIVELLDRDRLGLIDDPPGRRTIYAHRNSDSLWHFWDQNEEARIPIEKEAVRGVLTDCFCYVKRSAEGESTKVRVALQCASAEYEIETSLNATSGRGLMSGLLEAGEDIERPITIGVRPADKEQVLFMDVYTDESGLQINGNHIGAGDEEAALDAVRSVRERLGLSADPFDNRISNRDDPHQGGSSADQGGAQQNPPPRGETPDSGGSAANPSGDPRTSGSAQKRERESVTSVSEDTRQTLKKWDEALSGIEDVSRLSDALDNCRDKIENWPPAHKAEAEKMLSKHENRVFEPDDELPFS